MNPILKVVTSATFIRGELGILKRIILLLVNIK